MKLRPGLVLLLLLAVAACSGPQPAAPTGTPAAAPEVQPTSVPPRQPPPATVPPTKAAAPASTAPAPTEPLPSPTDTATAAPAATRPRPTPAALGPLRAAIYVANCRSAPTDEKPGRVIVQISVEASGGDGSYRYFYQDKESPAKFIEVAGEKGTRLIGEVKVASGDGQEIKQAFDIAAKQLACP